MPPLLTNAAAVAEVVILLSSTDWTLIFDGKSITLDPSVGNWSFACHKGVRYGSVRRCRRRGRSHYWIRRGKVQRAEAWTHEEIDVGRAGNRVEKQVRKDRAFGPLCVDGFMSQRLGAGKIWWNERKTTLVQKPVALNKHYFELFERTLKANMPEYDKAEKRFITPFGTAEIVGSRSHRKIRRQPAKGRAVE